MTKKIKPLFPLAFAVSAGCLLSVFLLDGVLMFFVSIALVLAVSGAAVWLFRKRGWSFRRWLTALGAPVLLLLVIIWSYLPLRIVFRHYRPQFDQIILQIEAGNPPQTPFRIGPFSIRMVGQGRGTGRTPYLATNEAPWEIDGFVRHPQGHGFNCWSRLTLDEDWAYIKED